MSERVTLHELAAGRVGVVRWPARFRPIVGSCDRLVVDVTGADELVGSAGEGLPPGPARAEAIAVRLRRRGVAVEWGAPRHVTGASERLRVVRELGASSVAMARADPSLVPELHVGSWFDAGWALRLVSRVLLALPPLPLVSRTRVALYLAFWRGVRNAATAAEWQRLTGSSYVALVYHRLAGELKHGQEKVDLSPRSFERQLRLLRRLGFRHLRPEEVLEFHEGAQVLLPRRAFVVTVDDGTLDCLEPLVMHATMGPQLFVPTAEVGGSAHWLDGEPLLSWEDVRTLEAAGLAVGSHARRHRRLTGLTSPELVEELTGSRDDLRERTAAPVDVVAYPNGDHDARVRRAARDAGYRAAFTTERGRNGAGTDVYCLRRVSVHGADGRLAVLWKVATGEALPAVWLRLRVLRRRIYDR